ncbi:MAG: hypothetical protein V3R94_10970 [Acidobacteriota bacterium]
MNIDSKELRDERLRHPNEAIRESGSSPARSTTSLLVISVIALILGLGLAFGLYTFNQKFEAREIELNDLLAQLNTQMVLVGQQLEEGNQHRGVLETDLETVQQRVGVTQGEIKKAREQAEEMRQEQQESVEMLNRQLVTKAESDQVESLGEKTDTRFVQVGEQIIGVEEQVAASREELEETWQELSSLGLLLTEQGKLIATTGDALEELRQKGERDYLPFDARRKQKISVANIVIELRKADYKKHRADLRLFYDDKRVDRKQVYTNTPLTFYVGADRVPYELVINQVVKDQISGYISAPLGKLTTSQGLRRPTD